MLYPYRSGLFAVIDPGRTVMPLPRILVPIYPQIGDMVLVKGDDDERQRAHVGAVDHRSKSARGYFFVKHRNWNANQQWVRESQARAMDTIQFKSIVAQWKGSGMDPTGRTVNLQFHKYLQQICCKRLLKLSQFGKYCFFIKELGET